MARPRTALPSAPSLRTRPSADPCTVALSHVPLPSSSMRGEPAYPGCDVASTVVGPVIVGRIVTGLIRHTTPVHPGSDAGMLNVIVSAPALAFAFVIA